MPRKNVFCLSKYLKTQAKKDSSNLDAQGRKVSSYHQKEIIKKWTTLTSEARRMFLCDKYIENANNVQCILK